VEEYEDTVERIFEEFSGEEEPFIAKSSAMKTVMDAIDDYARTEVPVLLLGESGTGKTRLAEIIHKKSKRAGAFIRRNCADFEGQTGLSELRGHEKGVFTDAKDARDSIFVAKGGTVFLDEITCLPMPLQAMLLDAVEGRPIFAIGAQKGEPPDCRFIFATHANLDEMVSKGVFREDFLARIGNDAVIRCPALRERSDEIIPLFEVYFARALKTLGGQATKPSLPTEVVNALMGYAWPKNIRELAKVAFHAAVKAKRNNTTVVRLDMINDRLINKTNPVSPVAHNSRSIAQLSELRDPPLDESVSVIRIALHPKNTTGPATGWKKLKERNALAVLVAKLREKNLDLTFESLHERCGVSVPKLIEMEKCGKEQLAKVSTSGGQV
jgi:DNA-binding NtrC family response regulator